MAALDDITNAAQDVYFAINGAENDDIGTDLTAFQNNFIRAFNNWILEYETEAYWNKARVSDYVLGTVLNTTDFSFALPVLYRTPIFDQNKYLKLVLNDGTVITKFKMVDPSQRIVDDEFRATRATFSDDGKIILSRAPNAEEVGAKMVLDVVKYFPKLTTSDSSALLWPYNATIRKLGIAKNMTLADVTKVSLSPTFSQQYTNELNKAVNINNASNEIDTMQIDIGITGYGIGF